MPTPLGEINGNVKLSNGTPVNGALVRAYDIDSGLDGANDFMVEGYTDANGNYKLLYDRTAGRWDTYNPLNNSYRPDIHLRVLMKNAAGHLVKVVQSPTVHNDHIMKNPLTENFVIPATSTQTQLTKFDFKKHVFSFDNYKGPICINVLGKSYAFDGGGFCGGICAAALNRFNNGQSCPADPQPALGTPLYKEFNDRILKTLSPNTVLRLLEWQLAPDKPSTLALHSIGARTRLEWPNLRLRLDSGVPVILMLVRVQGTKNPGDNHQVLAVGYELREPLGDVTIFIYDPNDHKTKHTLQVSLKEADSQLSPRASCTSFRGFFMNSNTDAAAA